MVRTLPIRNSHHLDQPSPGEEAGVNESFSFLVRVFWTLYLSLAALQIFAVAGGLLRTVNAPLWLAAIVALVIGPWPVIGTVLGVAGAHYGWGIAWTAASILFLAFAVPIAAIVLWASRGTGGGLAFRRSLLSLHRTS